MIMHNLYFSLGDIINLNPYQLVCVLSAGRRNYSSDVTRRTVIRKISYIRNDISFNKVSKSVIAENHFNILEKKIDYPPVMIFYP